MSPLWIFSIHQTLIPHISGLEINSLNDNRLRRLSTVKILWHLPCLLQIPDDETENQERGERDEKARQNQTERQGNQLDNRDNGRNDNPDKLFQFPGR
jgi:hypothetical protein